MGDARRAAGTPEIGTESLVEILVREEPDTPAPEEAMVEPPVVSESETVRFSVVGLHEAVHALRDELGPIVDAEYVPGKTLFRDLLCARFGLSELDAETLCDDLERAALVRFVSGPSGFGWHVHEEGEASLEPV